jgi:hypothetical protein
MCTVLGVDYKKKLFEMGVISDEDLDVSRVYDQMHFLQVTIDENYKKVTATSSHFFLFNVSKHLCVVTK